jgi:hypothetical protein
LLYSSTLRTSSVSDYLAAHFIGGKHVVWVTPREAISSNIDEMTEFDEAPIWLVPTKSKPKQKDLLRHIQHEPDVDKLKLPEYRITLVEAGNHLRL